MHDNFADFRVGYLKTNAYDTKFEKAHRSTLELVFHYMCKGPDHGYGNTSVVDKDLQFSWRNRRFSNEYYFAYLHYRDEDNQWRGLVDIHLFTFGSTRKMEFRWPENVHKDQRERVIDVIEQFLDKRTQDLARVYRPVDAWLENVHDDGTMTVKKLKRKWSLF